jgi:hypothetical protein
MLVAVERGINVILNQFDFPDLHIKIGIDSGQKSIIKYGSKRTKSNVDIMVIL